MTNISKPFIMALQGVFLIQTIEEIDLTVNAECLGSNGKSDDFQVGKLVNYATS